MAGPQCLEISFVAHQPSCFGGWFSLCWFTVVLFLCLAPFLWGKVRDLSYGSLLSACYAGLLTVFNFATLFTFGWCSLAQEMSFVDRYLPYFRLSLSPTPICPSAFPVFVY
jgi:hypothetical protein